MTDCTHSANVWFIPKAHTSLNSHFVFHRAVFVRRDGGSEGVVKLGPATEQPLYTSLHADRQSPD